MENEYRWCWHRLQRMNKKACQARIERGICRLLDSPRSIGRDRENFFNAEGVEVCEEVVGKKGGKKMRANEEMKRWRGAISRCRNLNDQAVICLFEHGWGVSPTSHHTHNLPFLHFGRGELNRRALHKAEKYFRLHREMEGYNPMSGEYEIIQREIDDLFRE